MSEESDHEEALLAMYVGGEEQDAAASVTPRAAAGEGRDEEGEAAAEERPREKRHKSGGGRYFALEEQLCSNCGQPGHLLRNCTLPYASSAACFFCGQIGHIQANCPLKVRFSRLFRKRCCMSRAAADCSSLSFASVSIRNVSQMDTLSTNFVAEEQCRSCFRVGHDERRCPERRRVADSVHAVVASILKKRDKSYCANCASVNHATAQCRLPRYEEDYATAVKTTPRFSKKEKTARAAQECYACGEVGHLKKDCPDKDRPRRREPPPRPFARDRGNDRSRPNDRGRERDRRRRSPTPSPPPPHHKRGRDRSRGAGRHDDRSERRVFAFDD